MVPILVSLLMEVMRSFETSVLARAIGCNIPEDPFFMNILFTAIQHLLTGLQ
jgi:hypothetical protein